MSIPLGVCQFIRPPGRWTVETSPKVVESTLTQAAPSPRTIFVNLTSSGNEVRLDLFPCTDWQEPGSAQLAGLVRQWFAIPLVQDNTPDEDRIDGRRAAIEARLPDTADRGRVLRFMLGPRWTDVYDPMVVQAYARLTVALFRLGYEVHVNLPDESRWIPLAPRSR